MRPDRRVSAAADWAGCADGCEQIVLVWAPGAFDGSRVAAVARSMG
jgi:hypothetical protein